MDWIEWVRDRPFYADQIGAHRQITASDPTYIDLDLAPALETALADRGISQLYGHQGRAINAIRAGNDVVIATPTASGKSIGYGVPALERAQQSDARTLYIAPQNALIEDQESWLTALADDVDPNIAVHQYTGRMEQYVKRAVRDREPSIVLTTPDMLHYGLLPHSRRLWDWFFKNLDLIVLDEVHAYRGIFGSHVALLLRRLNRLCATFDASPQFVCCSATIGNPVEHVASLTGRPAAGFSLIADDESESGPRSWMFWRPPEMEDSGHGRRRSAHVETMQLFVALVKAGYQTLAFGRSRQLVERYAMESQRKLRGAGEDDLANSVRAYEAALTHDRRTALEDGLRDGSIRGVWSTSALELGVDIGGLDAVLLDGYPGTRTDTHQRAGRAGRGSDPCLIGLIAGEDQLDQYILNHPDTLFESAPEAAVVNPENEQLLPDHLRCAAQESWLTPDDATYFGDRTEGLIEKLVEDGTLEHRSNGTDDRWIDNGDDSPQHSMNLRRSDREEVTLVHRDSGDSIARLARQDAMRDAHTGAIYHHQGQAYEVVDLDLSNRRAELAPTWADHYTRVRHEKDISITEINDSVEIGSDHRAEFGTLSVRTHITGFARMDGKTGKTMSEVPLSMPEMSLTTEGIIIQIPPDIQSTYTEDGEFLGGIHAIEHAMISLFPLEVLCDRGDIGGLSTPHHTDTEQATIFVYDGHDGGVGLTHSGFDRLPTLLSRTHALIAACSCTNGCPACVQSPQCGNGNEPLDPETAVHVLEAMLPQDTLTKKP